ncbi:3,4-dihydroxy-2-butanone-4-phosphate synthase [Alkalicoccus chagannorensis]|uniref:3,4-dihydroxy-2-butanone-4-phosphate synthase n=1 Tax=Alkalicoccus chagannorensis TaxID=427072 RepID=UPI00041F581C|nr:3,4-dihydroxy-2-butanone-4-phosphate synthase [Alkalicoccus chagannorensis]
MTNEHQHERHISDYPDAAVIFDDIHHQTGYVVGSDQDMHPDFVNFLAFHAKGLVAYGVSKDVQLRLDLPVMNRDGTDRNKEMLVSIDHVSTTTGISAAERAHSMQKSLASDAAPEHFQRPGHVFPCLMAAGGLPERAGAAEAAFHLMQQQRPESTSAVFCEILNTSGNIASVEDIRELPAFTNTQVHFFSDLLQEALRQQSWLEITEHITAPGSDGIHVLTVRDTLQHLTFKLYTTLEASGTPQIVSYSPCEQGDLLRHGQCSCEAHFSDYYKQLQDREIDAIAFYSMQPLASPPSDSLTGIIHQQQQKLLEKHRVTASG